MDTITRTAAKFVLMLRALILNGGEVTAELAQDAAAIAADRTNLSALIMFATVDTAKAALTWLRIAEYNSGQAQLDALTVAAYLAHAGGHHTIAAFAIAWQRRTAADYDIDVPMDTQLLSFDYRIAAELAHAG